MYTENTVSHKCSLVVDHSQCMQNVYKWFWEAHWHFVWSTAVDKITQAQWKPNPSRMETEDDEKNCIQSWVEGIRMKRRRWRKWGNVCALYLKNICLKFKPRLLRCFRAIWSVWASQLCVYSSQHSVEMPWLWLDCAYKTFRGKKSPSLRRSISIERSTKTMERKKETRGAMNCFLRWAKVFFGNKQFYLDFRSPIQLHSLLCFLPLPVSFNSLGSV